MKINTYVITYHKMVEVIRYLNPQVFHGAARLVQPGQATNIPTGPQHTAVRRAFNADITKETKNNVGHFKHMKTAIFEL